jgi:membrane fusion protein, multidrug efflux system
MTMRMMMFVAVLGVSGGACRSGEVAPASPPAATTPGPIGIDLVNVVQQPLDVQLSLPGELTAYQTVAVYPRVSGFVKSVSVDRGSRVRTGQVIAMLEAPELLSQRAEAQSKLQAAEAQLVTARAKADADKGTYDKLRAASATPGVVAGNDVTMAEKAVEGSQGQITASQQTVEAARQALKAVSDIQDYLQIRAPFDGVVTERNVHPGALVGPLGGAGAAPMLRIVQDRQLRLVVSVPEAYTAEMKAGTTIPFVVSAYPGQSWSGTVARIAHVVDVSTRTMAVELDVENPEGLLAPGTFCQVRWPLRRSTPSLFVPSASVAATTDRTFVIRVRDGKTEWVDVKTGITSGPLVEVFGDLTAGDVVAGRGTDELRPGTSVQAREPKPAS